MKHKAVSRNIINGSISGVSPNRSPPIIMQIITMSHNEVKFSISSGLITYHLNADEICILKVEGQEYGLWNTFI
jgi:hypothetical protein